MIVQTSLPLGTPGAFALLFAVVCSGLINYPVYLVIFVLCILYSMYWFSQTLIACALDTEGMVLRVSSWLCPWRSRTLNVSPGDKIILTIVKFSIRGFTSTWYCVGLCTTDKLIPLFYKDQFLAAHGEGQRISNGLQIEFVDYTRKRKEKSFDGINLRHKAKARYFLRIESRRPDKLQLELQASNIWSNLFITKVVLLLLIAFSLVTVFFVVTNKAYTTLPLNILFFTFVISFLFEYSGAVRCILHISSTNDTLTFRRESWLGTHSRTLLKDQMTALVIVSNEHELSEQTSGLLGQRNDWICIGLSTADLQDLHLLLEDWRTTPGSTHVEHRNQQ